MPTEKTTSSSEATCSLPCSTSLAKLGNWLRNTAPKNHIQLMPSSERNTTVLPCASFRLRQVSVKGFQLISRPGSVAGDAGNDTTHYTCARLAQTTVSRVFTTWQSREQTARRALDAGKAEAAVRRDVSRGLRIDRRLQRIGPGAGEAGAGEVRPQPHHMGGRGQARREGFAHVVDLALDPVAGDGALGPAFGNDGTDGNLTVIPAQAGIQSFRSLGALGPRLRGDDAS